MIFKEHLDLIGKHALLSPSKHSWINYNKEQMQDAYLRWIAAQKGTEDHEFAATCIKRKQKLPKSERTLNMYVNDAIGYQMTPEQPLYVSRSAFGTTDAICFRKNVLRIHDLKTGATPASISQLEIYAAFFCLEYGIDPKDIATILRIYQSNEINEEEADPERIKEIMKKALDFSEVIDNLEKEET